MASDADWILGERCLSMPLTFDGVLLATNIGDGAGSRTLTKEELSWLQYLMAKSKTYSEICFKKREKYIVNVAEDETIGKELHMFYEIQLCCAYMLLLRCGYYMERDMRIGKDVQQNSEAYIAESSISDFESRAKEQINLSSQQRAAVARGEKTLEAWKPAIAAMIKIAVLCGAEGPRLRQQPDFNTMFNEIDAELSDSQMSFFRKCLPDEYVDRTGGERGKN